MFRKLFPRLCRNATAGVGTSHGTPPSSEETLQRLRDRLSPSKGTSSTLLQAIVEDEFPLFHPSQVGASTMREVVLQHPQLFRLHVLENGNWEVFPTPPPSTPAAGDSNSREEEEVLKKEYQKIRRYCEEVDRTKRGMFIPLDSVLYHCGVENSAIVDHLIQSEKKEVEVRLSLRVKPRRLPRAAVLLVDGDELSITVVNSMLEQLNLLAETSQLHIFRQPYSKELSYEDVVAPSHVPTPYLVEKKAREIRLTSPDLLKDVIYVCSSRQFKVYSDHVSPQNSFPDADVYVCSPSKIQLVHEKKLVPI